MSKDVLGHAPHDRTSNAAAAVRLHDDQISAKPDRFVQDDVPGGTAFDHV